MEKLPARAGSRRLAKTEGLEKSGRQSQSIDPVREIGRLCRENNLWLHVDSAMSGTAALCPEFRFLHDGMVMPLGSEKSHHVSVRLIAATHRDLKSLVESGRFREDFYYRLAGYEVTVPSLRERQATIPLRRLPTQPDSESGQRAADLPDDAPPA